MKAIVLAAGRGERLRPLTDATPRPLLRAGGRALIDWQVEALVAGGFDQLVVNHAHLGEQIVEALGDGARFGARILYSAENPALETAGGIARALLLLGDRPFAAVSADINTDYDYANLRRAAEAIERDPAGRAAHLVLVRNPDWHPGGDMGLVDGRITRDKPWFTYASMGVFHPGIFRDVDPHAPLRMFPWLHTYTAQRRVTGEVFEGAWDNVGTAAQLADLDRRLTE